MITAQLLFLLGSHWRSAICFFRFLRNLGDVLHFGHALLVLFESLSILHIRKDSARHVLVVPHLALRAVSSPAFQTVKHLFADFVVTLAPVFG